MTIKELCKRTINCGKCPFEQACYFLDCKYPNSITYEDDKLISKSIIETAIKLTESEVNNG